MLMHSRWTCINELHDDAHGLHKSDPRRRANFVECTGNIPDGFHLTRANPSQEVVRSGEALGRNGLARWHKVVGAAEIGL